MGFLEEESPKLLIQQIEGQIQDSQKLNDRLRRRRDLFAEELALAEKKFAQSAELFAKKLISEDNHNQTQTLLLEKRQAMEQAENSILNNRIQISEYHKSIMAYRKDFQERSRTVMVALEERFKQLESAFAEWEHKYVLKAPNQGFVSLFKFNTRHQYVAAGEEVLAVVPSQEDLVGKVYLPQDGSGKVRRGQSVQIRFESYPHEQFGMVLGEVAGISPVTRDQNYLITVKLTGGLVSTYGQSLEYKHDMKGDADIITEELRLLQRVFHQFRHFWSSYT